MHIANRGQPGAGRALVRGLAGACHPAPTLAVTTMSLLLAVAVGLPATRAVLLASAVLAGQLSIGWSNDRLDAARDSRSARTDKPAATGAVALPVLGAAAALALAAAITLSLALGWRPGLAALVLVAAGWAYNLGLKATVLSGAAYLVGFAALPAVPYLARTGAPWPPWWAPAAGALLGLGAHVANVLPDLVADAATGVRGLPHRIGPDAGIIVLAGSLGGAAVVLGLGARERSAPVAITIVVLGLAAAAVAGILARPRTAAAFRLTLVLALADVVLLLVLAG